MDKVVKVNGDLRKAQEIAWHTNMTNTLEVMFFYDAPIHEGMNEFMANYRREKPGYELVDGSTYTMRELLAGYLEQKAKILSLSGERNEQ